MIIAQVIFNLVIFILWPCHFIYHSFVIGKGRKQRRDLNSLISQVDHRYRWDRDRLSTEKLNRLKEIKNKAKALLSEKQYLSKTDDFIAKSISFVSAAPTAQKPAWLKEWVELLIVVFGIVMGARAFFFQPFKIPTGSMQPTLHGINFMPEPDSTKPNVFRRIFDYVNYSYRYTDTEVQENGALEPTSIISKNPFVFFPYTKFQIGDDTYKLPGSDENVLRYLSNYRNRNYPQNGIQYFKKGETLVKGHLMLGDHLFVDRLRFNFVEPKRGDITVFVTDGIRNINGKPLRGRFFIKRLVGLPGDEIKISNRKLYVRTNDKESFELVDEKFHPGFNRIYSFKGGYRGYSHPPNPSCQYLRNSDETFQLGKNDYFMLGDNSENSMDSRFWGVVPRHNIVGRANFVYWPFSRRWGFADSAEPEDFDSPPTK